MTSMLICSAAWLGGWRVSYRNSPLPACSSLAAAPGCSAGICWRAIPTGLSSSPTSHRRWSSNAGAILLVASEQRVSFEIMDAARPTADGPFDLIATSMTLHWLADPAAALATLRRQLAPGGVLIYATISGKSFPEWREVLAAQGLPVGLLEIPELPGVIDEERIVADHRHARLPAPHEGGRRSDAARGLRRFAARQASPRHPRRRQAAGGRITWHIVYGRLAASQSSPSISPA